MMDTLLFYEELYKCRMDTYCNASMKLFWWLFFLSLYLMIVKNVPLQCSTEKIAAYGFWIIRGWENNDKVLYLGLYLGIFYIFKRMTMDIYIFKHFHSENAALWKTEMSGSQNKVLLINYVNHSSNLTVTLNVTTDQSRPVINSVLIFPSNPLHLVSSAGCVNINLVSRFNFINLKLYQEDLCQSIVCFDMR